MDQIDLEKLNKVIYNKKKMSYSFKIFLDVTYIETYLIFPYLQKLKKINHRINKITLSTRNDKIFIELHIKFKRGEHNFWIKDCGQREFNTLYIPPELVRSQNILGSIEILKNRWSIEKHPTDLSIHSYSEGNPTNIWGKNLFTLSNNVKEAYFQEIVKLHSNKKTLFPSLPSDLFKIIVKYLCNKDEKYIF